MLRAVMSCLLLFAAVAGYAKERKAAVMLNMAFDFVAVERALPAGDYYFWQKQKNKVVMWSNAAPEALELFSVPVLRPVTTPEPKMFFVVMSGQKRLWRYFPPGANTGIEFAVPGLSLGTNQEIPKAVLVSDKASILERHFAGRSQVVVRADPNDEYNKSSSSLRRSYRRTY